MDNLTQASRKQRKVYNRSAKDRNTKIGDKVLLVLLPTDSNKLLMQWKRPFVILEKVGRVDYRININGKIENVCGDK